MITCDRGRRRLAFFRYKWGGAEPPSPISSWLACFFLLAPLLTTMAPIRRFSAEEKGKAPRDDPGHFRRRRGQSITVLKWRCRW